MKKLLLTLCAVCALSLSAWSQSRTIENVRKASLRDQGYIMENKNLVGYYLFYFDDKVDNKSSSYIVNLLDNDLNSVKTFNVLRPKKSRLIEMTFNGSAFFMMYYSGGDIEMVTYDKTGKQLGSVKNDDPSKWEKARLSQATDEAEINASVFASGPNSFVRQSFLKNDKLGYLIEGYSNDMKQIWKYGSDENSKLVETADIMFATEKYIGVNIARKKNLMSKSYDGAFLLLDAVTGKKAFEAPLRDKGSELTLINSFVDDQTGEIGLIGEYYPEGSEIMKSKSVGLYINILDAQGTVKTFKKYGWATDIKKFRNLDDNTKDKNMVYFHKVVRTKDGNILMIGEQYRKQASALGIASMVLNGGNSGTSVAEMRIKDMVAITLNPSYELTDFKVFEKKDYTINLPAGSEYFSSTLLANYIKAMGGFDYEFSSLDYDHDTYFSVYHDFNRKVEDGKKSDTMIGIIKYENGKLTSQRIPINTDGNLISFKPAKPGYFTVIEYFRKKKTIKMHLEKISN